MLPRKLHETIVKSNLRILHLNFFNETGTGKFKSQDTRRKNASMPAQEFVIPVAVASVASSLLA